MLLRAVCLELLARASAWHLGQGQSLLCLLVAAGEQLLPHGPLTLGAGSLDRNLKLETQQTGKCFALPLSGLWAGWPGEVSAGLR